jgi:hypothetical protein
MVGRRFRPDEFEVLFRSLRNLVDEAEAAQRSGTLSLARHATANLAFATQLIHTGLRERGMVSADV